MKANLSKIIIMNNGNGQPAVLHVSVLSHVVEEDVSHTLSATVVLEYANEDVMKLTLADIRNHALSRLPKPIELD